jgi:hypothetical protein
MKTDTQIDTLLGADPELLYRLTDAIAESRHSGTAMR